MNQSAEAYERAISESDVSAIAAQYADAFMFGGPQGVQSIKKDDFLKVVPRRKEYFASIGLLDSKGTSVDEMSLDSKYLLVKTTWSMTFEKPTGVKEQIKTLATYIFGAERRHTDDCLSDRPPGSVCKSERTRSGMKLEPTKIGISIREACGTNKVSFLVPPKRVSSYRYTIELNYLKYFRCAPRPSSAESL